MTLVVCITNPKDDVFLRRVTSDLESRLLRHWSQLCRSRLVVPRLGRAVATAIAWASIAMAIAVGVAPINVTAKALPLAGRAVERK